MGGAWAFDSEASAGHTVPTLDSIKRFLSPFEQDQLWQNPDYNQYHANYEPDLPGPDNGGYSFGTLHDLDAAISSSLRPVVEPRSVRGGGPGPELRDPARRVRGLHRPLDQPGRAVDRDRLLAAQQGLAHAAVGSLQLRLRPGRQLLRGQEGERAAACPVCLRHRSGVGRQSRRLGPARAVGRVEGLRGGRQAPRRPDRERHLGRQPGSRARRPPSRRARHHAAAHAGADLLRRAAPHAPRSPGRSQRLLALDAAGPRRLGRHHRQPAGDDDPIREPHSAPVAGRRHRPRDRRHPAVVGWRRRWRHRDRRHDHERLEASRPSRSSSAPTSAAAPPVARPRQATTRFCRSCGATTT